MAWAIFPLLLILYGEDEPYGEDEAYGESRYGAERGTDRSSGDRYGVDALLYGLNAETNQYAALLEGGSVYWDSTQDYQQHRYDGM